MKLHVADKRKVQAFTLIEMIGVLAVIAILAAVLVPKVFEAINSSRINNAAMSCQTVKTALTDHYAKFGSLISSNGVLTLTPGSGTALTYDMVLLQEGFLDKPFAAKISTTTNSVQLMPSTGTNAPTAIDAGYALSGSGVNEATPGNVVECVLSGVAISDARDLSDRIDGATLSQLSGSTNSDLNGRVKYAGSATTTDVHVYLTHR